MSEKLSSSAESSLTNTVGANIRTIVDGTKAAVGIVCGEIVQTTGEVLHFTVDAVGHLGGKAVHSIGTGTVELAKAVVGGKFRKSPKIGKTQKA